VEDALDVSAAHEIAHDAEHRLLHTVPQLAEASVLLAPLSLDPTQLSPI
jgi:divalent metal cation (Fe/Co/Zn/Cd) transporter